MKPLMPTRPALERDGVQFFDVFATEYDALRSAMRDEDRWTFEKTSTEAHLAFLATWAPQFHEWARRLSWPKGSIHVDIGGGAGLLSYLIAKQGYHSTSLELAGTNALSGALLTSAVRPTTDTSLQIWVANIYDIPAADHSVDFVTVKEVLHHLTDVDGLLCELKRVLKPNGKLYVWEPFWPSRWLLPVRWLLVDQRIRPRETANGVHHVYRSLAEYKRALHRHSSSCKLTATFRRSAVRHYLSQHPLMFGQVEAELTLGEARARFAAVNRPRRQILPEDFVSGGYLRRAQEDTARCREYLDSL